MEVKTGYKSVFFMLFKSSKTLFSAQANNSHKKYGICRYPAKNDSLKNNIIIAKTRIVSVIAVIKAFFISCSLKKAFVQ